MKADVLRRVPLAACVVAAALLAGCEPGAEGGYAKIAWRPDPKVPRHAFPDPPAVTPGTSVGAQAARIVATNLPSGVTQAMVDQGQDLYGTVCASCHGQGGAGSPAGPQLNDNQWLNIAGQYPEIVSIINAGVANPKQYPGVMPPKGGGSFDDAQVNAIGAYVYALSHQGGA